ncbi:hypothetical protein [Stenotrophomonas sp. 278]|uniref:hypothetical protein n=1 Tax=Stenotrophomonas sp. 278 TaxID=2479851 RepID=UPI000F67BBD4|nr:hypothetical protein [Stenotrophomonas sp. 278]RRU22222.1 hypothetical protein EGJ34_03690 [Stenotrophomonas sp. 278]
MEDNSPYRASKVVPAAGKTDQLDLRDPPPSEITGPIKHMWILLVVMGSWIVLAGVMAMIMAPKLSMFVLITTVAVGGLYLLAAFGVYKRSRITATLVLVVCCLGILSSLIRLARNEAQFGTIAFVALLTFVSIRGTIAIYRYHRHLANRL